MAEILRRSCRIGSGWQVPVPQRRKSKRHGDGGPPKIRTSVWGTEKLG